MYAYFAAIIYVFLMNVYSRIAQNIMSLLFPMLYRAYYTRMRVCACHNYHRLLSKALRNCCESFFIDRVKRILVASEALCNSLLVKNKFRVEPRANLRLSEMLLGKFRVAAAEARSFMRVYL